MYIYRLFLRVKRADYFLLGGKGDEIGSDNFLFRHLAAVIHVNAHDFAAVLSLTGHEVEVRLVRLGDRVAGRVQAPGAPVVIPAVLCVITGLNGRRVPGAGRPWQTVRRSRPDHPIRTTVNTVVAVHAGRTVADDLSVTGQTGYRRRRRLLLCLERFEREIRVRARRVILPGVADDQTLLKQMNKERLRIKILFIENQSSNIDTHLLHRYNCEK